VQSTAENRRIECAGKQAFAATAARTSREASQMHSLPVVQSKGVTRAPYLLAENKYAGLPSETHFFDLAVFSQEN
jgi:hypothetical protein